MKKFLVAFAMATLSCAQTAAQVNSNNGSFCSEPIVVCKKEPYGFIVLSKKFEKIPGPRLVIALTKGGKILNPEGEVYPQTTCLRGLTFQQAELLFGQLTAEKDGVRTFSLVHVERQDMHFKLDTKFSNEDKLVAYRLSGPFIPVEQWIEIK